MRALDLFSGIGGFSYAAERLVGGFETTQFVEIDTYCQRVLHKNFPNVPIHHDITEFNATEGQFDVITAGFPCQDVSIAGRQDGIGEGTRSGLFFEVLRLARQIRPKFILFENVRNLLSHSEGETFQQILQEIAKAGFDVEWSVVSAKDVGACHKRERLWFIAYPSRVNEDRTEGSIQAGRDTATSSTTDATNTNCERLQGLRGKYELQESGKEKTVNWRNSGITLNSNWKGYKSKPTLCRGDDGLSNRVHRLKALGNSIVPQVAAIPLQRVLDLEKLTVSN